VGTWEDLDWHRQKRNKWVTTVCPSTNPGYGTIIIMQQGQP